ncbi:MAG: ABC transporter ATP-binding protein, partial [Pseudomonadota bacterium]|nr:ABC transporter ATP-binding protein [Pseudomonadota bacterium]
MEGSHPRRYDLRGWLGIFHPAYRVHLAGLLAIGLLGGILTYLNLELLQSLVKTFAAIGDLDNLGCAQAAEIHALTRFLVCSGIGPGWTVAVLVLLVYAGLELLQAALSVVRLYVQGLLEIKSRNDIEREVLVNLLRKDDQFFHRHSATQIANRLSEDTERIFERREDISALWSVSVQALGALAFLWSQHWSYAAAVLVFSLGGVYIIHRMLGRMKFLDGTQLQADDNVKAAFEDYLQAAPEAQMGNLTGKITRKLASIQNERQTAFMGLVNLSSKLTATYALTQLVAFGAIMSAIIYVVTVHGFTLEDGLVAAVVRAVPQLYGNISEVAKLVLKFQLADVSARRLLEYETAPDREAGPADAAPGKSPLPIVFDKVRYAFTPGGQKQGGSDGISLTVAPNSLNVIVGPSGSGKSMLSQLLMGRLKPIAGHVRYGDADIGEFSQLQRSHMFSYMPQSLAMITGTIGENIRFGLPEQDQPEDAPFDDGTRTLIDRTGVGRFAREKALDLPPVDAEIGALAGGLQSMRQAFRDRVAKEAKVELATFADHPMVPHLTMVENLTGSAAHTERMLRLAFTRTGFRAMDRLARLGGAEQIVGFGEHVIGQTAHILARCPSHDAYSELAPFHLHPPVWDLRSNLAAGGAVDAG